MINPSRCIQSIKRKFQLLELSQVRTSARPAINFASLRTPLHTLRRFHYTYFRFSGAFSTSTLRSGTRQFLSKGTFSHQTRSTALQAITGGALMDAYKFPDARLKKRLDDPSKTPLLLVACGSFSPITFLHLRMFVMAADYVKHNTEYEMIGGYLSPVSDAYKKQGLATAEHR